MNEITFDHDMSETSKAIIINNKSFREWLFEDDERAQKHLLSCMEVFVSHKKYTSFSAVAVNLQKTDFNFKTKLNIAWQLGLNLVHSKDFSDILQKSEELMIHFNKKSEWLEDIYTMESVYDSDKVDAPAKMLDKEERILLVTMMHALIY